MNRIFIKWATAFTIFSILTPAISAEYQGGARIVPILESIPSSSFNPATDAVSIYLEKAVLYKENGWFTNDKEVAITARVGISSRKQQGFSTLLTISRVYKFNVSIYEDGRMEIPLKNLPLLDVFNLSGDDYRVTGIVMDLFLSKKKEKTDFSRTLQTVIDVSKKIPIPVNPYADYASVFGDAFSQVIDKAIDEGADTVPFASFGLRFLGGDKPIPYTEKPGVYAIVVGSSSKGVGVISLEKLEGKVLSYNDYDGLKYGTERVRNNNLILRVIASTDPWKAVAMKSDILEKISSEGKSVVSFSKGQGISTPNLSAIIKKQSEAKSATKIEIDSSQIQEAVKELNSIKSINSIRSIEGVGQ